MWKSKPELRGDAWKHAKEKGRADIKGAALCLGLSWPTVKSRMESGEIASYQQGLRHYVTYEELVRYNQDKSPAPTYSFEPDKDGE